MRIENEFRVAAPAARVYAFLLDVGSVIPCVSGAELSEIVDPRTFRARVKVRVGPITVEYGGIVRIARSDPQARSATLEAEGREMNGPGSAKAVIDMTVTEGDDGVVVRLETELRLTGRVANFGRGIIQDVSRHVVGQMAESIKARLEATEPDAPSLSSRGAGDAIPLSTGEPEREHADAGPLDAGDLIRGSVMRRMPWQRRRGP